MNLTQTDGSPSSLRRTHRSLTLKYLLRHGAGSRTGLSEHLRLSPMAVSRIVRELIEAGLVEESGVLVREAGPGRRQTQLKIRDSGTYAAGIVVSAYSTEICIVNARGGLVAERPVPIDNLADGGAAVAVLAEALNRLVAELEIPPARIVGVGVAVAAHLDPLCRKVVSADYLGWTPFDLVDIVSEATGLFVRAENIAAALTLADTNVGVAKDMDSVVVVRTATTIGASIAESGELLRGHRNRSGRIGHFHHAETDLTCSCGRKDCLNCSASGWSVLARLGRIDESAYDPADVSRYAREINALSRSPDAHAGSTSAASAALEKAGRSLSWSLQTINLTVDPQAIVLAGSLSRVPAYMAGIEAGLACTGEGREVLDKLHVSAFRAGRAAAIPALLSTLYAPDLDFERLLESADLAHADIGSASAMMQAV